MFFLQIANNQKVQKKRFYSPLQSLTTNNAYKSHIQESKPYSQKYKCEKFIKAQTTFVKLQLSSKSSTDTSEVCNPSQELEKAHGGGQFPSRVLVLGSFFMVIKNSKIFEMKYTVFKLISNSILMRVCDSNKETLYQYIYDISFYHTNVFFLNKYKVTN